MRRPLWWYGTEEAVRRPLWWYGTEEAVRRPLWWYGTEEAVRRDKTGTLRLVQARAADTAACALKTDSAQLIVPVVFPQRLVWFMRLVTLLFCFVLSLAGCFVFLFSVFSLVVS